MVTRSTDVLMRGETIPCGNQRATSANRHQTRSIRRIGNTGVLSVIGVKATGKLTVAIGRLSGMGRERIRVRVQFAMGAENHNDIPIRRA